MSVTCCWKKKPPAAEMSREMIVRAITSAVLTTSRASGVNPTKRPVRKSPRGAGNLARFGVPACADVDCIAFTSLLADSRRGGIRAERVGKEGDDTVHIGLGVDVEALGMVVHARTEPGLHLGVCCGAGRT